MTINGPVKQYFYKPLRNKCLYFTNVFGYSSAVHWSRRKLSSYWDTHFCVALSGWRVSAKVTFITVRYLLCLLYTAKHGQLNETVSLIRLNVEYFVPNLPDKKGGICMSWSRIYDWHTSTFICWFSNKYCNIPWSLSVELIVNHPVLLIWSKIKSGLPLFWKNSSMLVGSSIETTLFKMSSPW